MAHLVMYRGETRRFHVELNTGGGADVDLTGATLEFVAYADPATPLIAVTPTIVDEEAGMADIVIPAADTDTADFSEVQNTTLFYVLRRTDSGNTDVVDAGLLIVRYLA